MIRSMVVPGAVQAQTRHSFEVEGLAAGLRPLELFLGRSAIWEV